MTVYSYSRVSTGRQASDGESLDAQTHRAIGYAMMIGEEIACHYVERGVSGSVRFADRPEGAQLLGRLRRGDKVICCKLDRCFRSALDALDQLAWFQQYGVELHLIDMGGNVCGNGIAKMVFTILSAVAEAERDRIRERISDVKAHQRANGRYLGGTVPFGFMRSIDGQLIENEEQQSAIKRMHVMREHGATLRCIAKEIGEVFDIRIGHRTVADILARRNEPGAPPSSSHTSSSGSGGSSLSPA